MDEEIDVYFQSAYLQFEPHHTNKHFQVEKVKVNPTKHYQVESKSNKVNQKGKDGVKLTKRAKKNPKLSNEIIVKKFNKWKKLRRSYIAQLKDMVIQFSEIFQTRQEKNMSEQLTVTFFPLLRAFRTVSCEVIDSFRKLERNSARDNVDLITNADGKHYIVSMVHSLDFLSVDPFISLLGVDVTMNPLITLNKINGESACLTGGMHYELVMSADEELACQKCYSVINSLFVLEHMKQSMQNPNHSRLASLKPFVQSPIAMNSALSCVTNSSVLRSPVNPIDNKNLSECDVPTVSTRSENEESDATGSQRSCVDEEFAARKFSEGRLRRGMQNWKNSMKWEQICSELRASRNYRNTRKCFDSFQRNLWQCGNFRRMQQRCNHRASVSAMSAWREYTLWCRRFNSLHGRCLRDVFRSFLLRWKDFSVRFDETRNFRKHKRQRLQRIVWTALIYNTLLNRHALRNRLKTQSDLTFHDKGMRIFCFHRWRRRVEMTGRLDELDERVELAHLKDAFVTWFFMSKKLAEEESAAIAKARVDFVLSAARSLSEIGEAAVEGVSKEGKSMLDSIASEGKKFSTASQSFLRAKLQGFLTLSSVFKSADSDSKEAPDPETSRKSRMRGALLYARQQAGPPNSRQPPV